MRLKFLRTHWFSLSLAGLGLAAWGWPGGERVLNPGGVTYSGSIALVFFLSGLSLKSEQLARAAANWRLHVLVQGLCFVVWPALMWGLMWPLRNWLPQGLVVGMYLLSVAPTTITSCVIFTQLSSGNTALALFNAVLGNMAGVIVSPAILMLMIGAGETNLQLDMRAIFTKLGLLVLVPLTAGQGAHWLLHGAASAWSGRMARINSLCVLVIVYFAFCKTFGQPELAAAGGRVGVALGALAPLHGLVLAGIWGLGGLLHLTRADRLAVLFCGSQKTLSLGLPLVAACLIHYPHLVGLASLPIIVYHPTQLLVASFVAPRAGRSL